MVCAKYVFWKQPATYVLGELAFAYHIDSHLQAFELNILF
jgi:hypothetical protein